MTFTQLRVLEIDFIMSVKDIKLVGRRVHMISFLFFHNQETTVTKRTAICYIEALLFYDRIHATAQETTPDRKKERKKK